MIEYTLHHGDKWVTTGTIADCRKALYQLAKQGCTDLVIKRVTPTGIFTYTLDTVVTYTTENGYQAV